MFSHSGGARRNLPACICNTKPGDSLSCTSPQIINFFVMTKTLGALTRQRAVAKLLQADLTIDEMLGVGLICFTEREAF